MLQLKLYLIYPPMNAERDGVTHVVAEITSSRAINGLELNCGLLLQADDGIGPANGIDLGLQWEVFKEPLKLVAVPQKFERPSRRPHQKGGLHSKIPASAC